MRQPVPLLGVALALAGCAPAEADTLPQAVRAAATRAASSVPDRLLVVAGTFGDTAMSFAMRQALVTAGVVVQEPPVDADSALAVLQFVSAVQADGGWRVRTTRSDGGQSAIIDALASEARVEWLVDCSAEQCVVRDSTAW